jgi:2-haloacid dehalogenase
MNKNEKTAPVIVFDIGGVLMDWDPYYLYRKILGNDRQAMEAFLKAVDFSGWNKEQDRGRSFAEGTAELTARFPEYSELIRAYDERYLESLGGAIQPVVEILRKLKDAGYSLFCLSNWSAEKFAQVRTSYPFFEWFDGLVISGEVRLIKPDKAIFELLLKRAGHPASECLFIDDHNSNIFVAKELGFQTILFQSPQQLEAELHHMGILASE